MIQDLLDVANIEAGKLALKVSTQDPCKLALEVVNLFEGASAMHPVTVRAPDHEILVSCDPLRIEQVVTNLVSNAIKYSPAGSPIEIEIGQAGREAVIAVQDHGIGISAADQRKVFEPFRRVGASKETIPGVGLGLFVVRRIAEAHGGRLELESEEGSGSIFRVILPISRP
jgi:signal transduction histidine kinase